MTSWITRRIGRPVGHRPRLGGPRASGLQYEALEPRLPLSGADDALLLAAAADAAPRPDFSLQDVNAASATYAQAVSPRDYLEQVSGWYFANGM